MVMHAYCLLDSKSGLFSQPWFFSHDVQAYRSVMELGNDKNTTVGKYPADFVLFRIGSFDDQVGVLLGEAHTNLGVVAAMLAAAVSAPSK